MAMQSNFQKDFLLKSAQKMDRVSPPLSLMELDK